MESIFLSLYGFFKQRRWVLYALFVLCVAWFGYCVTHIRIEEDISKFFPKDERIDKITEVVQHSQLMERLVVMVSLKDSTSTDPDKLIEQSNSLVNEISTCLTPYIQEIQFQVDDEIRLSLMDTLLNNLPVFISDEDYSYLDSLTTPANIRKVLDQNYKQLVSPAGIVMKRIMIKDPLGVSLRIFQRMSSIHYDKNFELYRNNLITKDHRYLLFFIKPTFPANDTGHNKFLIEGLNDIMNKFREGSGVYPSYFGAAAVAVSNSNRLRYDSILTGCVSVLFLFIFFIWFFKRKRIPLLILVPVCFGALFAISCVYLIQGYISVLAVAAGSMVLGIAVNYSLHFFVHLKYEPDIEKAIRDISRPMTIGSFTTVAAFFFLQFTNASVLRDLGLFAGFSLIGAALATLIFLPHWAGRPYDSLLRDKNWIDKILFKKYTHQRTISVVILLFTPLFLYFAFDVRFNSDMSKLNYMDSGLKKAEKQLNQINEFSIRSMYVVAHGENLERALQNCEHVINQVDSLKRHHVVTQYSSVSTFVVSDSTQQRRIDRWQKFWNQKVAGGFLDTLGVEARAKGFSEKIVNNFERLITKSYGPLSSDGRLLLTENLFSGLITRTDSAVNIVTLVSLPAEQRSAVLQTFDAVPGVVAIDKLLMVTLFVDFIQDDFNFIVTMTSLLVFVVLLVSFGRIELTLITFIPMLVTWIWILGIMAILGIEFNIINIMISTFIFGLGDDYSIFTMDALQQEYKLRKQQVLPVRVSVFLSVVTTVAGLGVLIIAQHPALKSIAAISIIGILSVFVMSQTLEPFLFHLLVTRRVERNLPPATLGGWIKTIFAYSCFVLGSFFLSFLGFVLLRLFRGQRKRMKAVFHQLISWTTRFIVYVMVSIRKRIVNPNWVDFNEPRIIICNHSSFMDILLTTMLHRKVILLTNQWVWDSPIFGGVVRLADYFPVTDNIENNLDELKEIVQQDYSLIIFPEGTRTKDGNLKRFHKGAFYLSEKLDLPVQPLLISGANDTIRKGDFYLQDGRITMKFLQPILLTDNQYGDTYQSRTKAISLYFRQEFTKLEEEVKTVDYYAYHLIKNYIYKGIVLEWYLRIKLKLEKNYAVFDELIPRHASVLDLGCGYGFLCYMLHFVSPGRRIAGVDYDEEKIETAQQAYSFSPEMSFACADIRKMNWSENFQTIVLSDVLHYMTPADREELMDNCVCHLEPGGKIIIRDGDKDKKSRHGFTRLTEFFSINLLKFNKASQQPDYLSAKEIETLARKHSLELKQIDNTRYTSNIIFVLTKG